MERRVLIAIFLSFIVLYAYQAIFVPSPPPTRSPSSPPASSETSPASGAQPGPPEAAPAATAPATIKPIVGESSERDVVLDTTTVRAVFTNRGARIRQWLLKTYRDDAGEPVNLVPTDQPPDQPLPFSLRIDEGGLTPILNSALYRVVTHEGDTPGKPALLVFEFEDASGLKVRKEFRLDPESYVITFSATVRQGDGPPLNPFVQWGPGLGDVGATSGGGSFFTGNYVQPPQAMLHNGDDVVRVAASKIPEQPVYEGSFRFAGVDDHYFLAAAVRPPQARIEYRPVTLPVSSDPTRQRQLLAHTYRFAQPPNGVSFYFGPKQFDVLKSVDGELVRAIQFGFFAWLAVPLLGALKWVYGFVGNYGWAIIILTILINLAIFPLRQKSVVSMRKMQALQPQLKAIQDRYADLKVTDPARQKMNTEIMNLYREKGVNPASGCVPMLLTLPVLFAFYSLLSAAIELRGAGFGGWIHDLSQHDPYYITPVLMGATMFWQQKITPTSADPTQQRMMMIMPLVFSFMFLRAPSGLVLYWFVSNLWAIGQQYFTNWLIGPPTVHVARPPAERRLKNAGSGRTRQAEKRS
ncbi:MAG TPA: membrane protein insertase YidC [Vicinamibacterales bacterium]|nr:membrane protein insertase YidC [Vicinamibacterales bacterium]